MYICKIQHVNPFPAKILKIQSRIWAYKIRCQLTPVRMAIKKSTDKTCWSGYGEK